MMWHEFEMIAGYSVTQQDYEEYIEPMYMALGGEVTKQDFVQMVNKKRFALPDPAAILRQVRKEARRQRALCGTGACDMKPLREKAELYAERKFGKGANVYFEYHIEYGYHEDFYPDVLVITCDGLLLERAKLQR